MKKIFVFLVTLLTFLSTTNFVEARSGCCSWHGGVSYCDGSVGRLVCSDGTYSPSCGCTQTVQPAMVLPTNTPYPTSTPTPLPIPTYTPTPTITLIPTPIPTVFEVKKGTTEKTKSLWQIIIEFFLG